MKVLISNYWPLAVGCQPHAQRTISATSNLIIFHLAYQPRSLLPSFVASPVHRLSHFTSTVGISGIVLVVGANCRLLPTLPPSLPAIFKERPTVHHCRNTPPSSPPISPSQSLSLRRQWHRRHYRSAPSTRRHSHCRCADSDIIVAPDSAIVAYAIIVSAIMMSSTAIAQHHCSSAIFISYISSWTESNHPRR